MPNTVPVLNTQLFSRFTVGGETVIQKVMTASVHPIIQELVKNDSHCTCTCTDGHDKRSFNARMPDIVGHVKGQPSTWSWLVYVGDNKKNITDSDNKKKETSNANLFMPRQQFTEEEISHLTLFMSELLEMQLFRFNELGFGFLYGFLFNGYVFQFFKFSCYYNNKLFSQCKLERSTVLTFETGFEWLWKMLHTPLYKLGFTLPKINYNGDNITINRFIGVGATSLVYECQCPTINGPFVMKIFKSNYINYYQSEKSAYQTLNSINSDNLSRLIGSIDDHYALLISPVGVPFASTHQDFLDYYSNPTKSNLVLFNSSHIKCLISTLKLIHSKSICHRDIKITNMFTSADNTFFINDLGSSCTIGLNKLFEGHFQFSPQICLDALAVKSEYKPQASHDLYMALCLVFSLLYPHIVHKLFSSRYLPGCVEATQNFWNKAFSVEPWKSLVEMIKVADSNELDPKDLTSNTKDIYEQLSQELAKLLLVYDK